MSRIGKKPIPLPKGVDVTLGAGTVAVKGPKGRLEAKLPPRVKLSQADGTVVCEREGDSRDARAAHGLVRALVANMVHGVSQGFERKLEINGVGYRAEAKGKSITLSLGYSHPIDFPLPEGVAAKVEKNLLILSGIDKAQVGQAAANIRALRPPEPYKGKGVKYLEERIIRKVGKAAG